MKILDIELDPLEKNREGALRLRKAPVWKYGYLIAVTALWGLCLPTVLEHASSPVFAMLTALGVLIAIALVVWYFLTNKVSGLHAAGLIQIVRGSGTRYQYRIEDGRIHKYSGESSTSWAPDEFLGAEVNLGEAILIFRTSVCYLPFRGAGRQQVLDFVKKVEQLAGNP